MSGCDREYSEWTPTATPSGPLEDDPRAKKALALSWEEARQLGHGYVGAEHMLLGLVAEGEGVAAQVLASLTSDLARVRDRAFEVMMGQVE